MDAFDPGKIAAPGATTPFASLSTEESHSGVRFGGRAVSTLGGAVGGPVGAGVGGRIGSLSGPKIGKTTMQAVRNAVDSGAFGILSAAKQGAVQTMLKMGDNAGVLKMLGTAAPRIARYISFHDSGARNPEHAIEDHPSHRAWRCQHEQITWDRG